MPKIDFSAYEGGREQAYIKHTLLEEYLPEWGFKVGTQWDSLVYVDGFAGPWDVKTPTFADSSFGIAAEALSRVSAGFAEKGKKLDVRCVLVEQDHEAFTKLKAYAESKTRPSFEVIALDGEFVNQIPIIQQAITAAGPKAFRFIFLDPKGWSDIPMSRIVPLLKARGSEVVINLMTRFMIRFLEQPDRAKSFKELFGRDDVPPVAENTPTEQKHELLVHEYCNSLRQLCGFRFVSSAIILEPKRDDIRYFLVYGTNHHRGVEVFKNAETKAAKLQDHLRNEKAIRRSGGQDNMMGTLFGEAPKSDYAFTLWRRYCEVAKRTVANQILRAAPKNVQFADLFCSAMSYPLVTPSDLQGWLDSWRDAGGIEIQLDGQKRRKPSPDHKDSIHLKDASSLQANAKA